MRYYFLGRGPENTSGRHRKTTGAHRLTGEHTPIQPEQLPAPSPERPDEPRGSQLVEYFRGGLVPGTDSYLGPDDVHSAIQLAATGPLDDQTAKELVAGAFELTLAAARTGPDAKAELEPLINELIETVYGNPNVRPTRLKKRLEAGESRTFADFGNSTITLKTLHSQFPDRVRAQPQSVVQLRQGPMRTWDMSIGGGQPQALPEDGLTLGREQPDTDPATWIGNTDRTSRQHVSLRPVENGNGLEVTNHSKRGTDFETLAWPDPSAIRARVGQEYEADRTARLDAARTLYNEQVRRNDPEDAQPR